MNEALAMARFFAFAAVLLAVIRAAMDTWRCCRRGTPWRRVVITKVYAALLIGILGYYIQALYINPDPLPTHVELIAINLLYGSYLLTHTIPRLRRSTDGR